MPGGFGERGIEGKIAAVKFAREKQVPYLGICLGLQVAVIEYARNVVGLAGRALDGAQPADAAPRDRADHRVAATATARPRNAARSRISAARCASARKPASSRTARSRGRSMARTQISERHRHRYEFNNRYTEQLADGGPRVLGFLERRARRAHRAAARRIRGSSRRSSTRSSRRTRATVTRCSRASSTRRALARD